MAVTRRPCSDVPGQRPAEHADRPRPARAGPRTPGERERVLGGQAALAAHARGARQVLAVDPPELVVRVLVDGRGPVGAGSSAANGWYSARSTQTRRISPASHDAISAWASSSSSFLRKCCWTTISVPRAKVARKPSGRSDPSICAIGPAISSSTTSCRARPRQATRQSGSAQASSAYPAHGCGPLFFGSSFLRSSAQKAQVQCEPGLHARRRSPAAERRSPARRVRPTSKPTIGPDASGMRMPRRCTAP